MKVILLLFLFIFANAKTMIAKYYAKYGWFGTIATATGTIEINETDYKIITEVKTVSIAATLTKHLYQSYTSIGKIKNSLLITQKYISYHQNDKKHYQKVYIFDHKNKKIKVTKYNMGKIEYQKTLPYYTNYDVLSLYFNLPLLLKKGEKNTFYALGGRKKDGKIDVTFPKGKELKRVKKALDANKGICIKANLYNKVFAGDKGILYLVIESKNWITLKGMVKNVLKIGDLKGGIEKLTIKQAP